jgi:hypothetical protein
MAWWAKYLMSAIHFAIPGARCVSLESGGHLMLGQAKNLAAPATFLAAGGFHASHTLRNTDRRGAVLVSGPPVDEPVGSHAG